MKRIILLYFSVLNHTVFTVRKVQSNPFLVQSYEVHRILPKCSYPLLVAFAVDLSFEG